MNDSSKLSQDLSKIKSNLLKMDQHLEELITAGTFEDQCSKMDAVEVAKLEATLAYILSTLSTTFLSLNPALQKDLTEDHPMIRMLERVKGYISKIKLLQASSESGSGEKKKEESSALKFIRNTMETFGESMEE